MKEAKPPVNVHKAYHAHVYFDQESTRLAKTLRDEISKNFNLKVGRFHESPVGPHPNGSYQVAFGKRDFDECLGWLEQRRNGLTVLVHGMTGDDLKDHTEYAYWMGEEVDLNLSVFG